MLECDVWDCRKEATRRLIVAFETGDGSSKITVIACQRHGDALDDRSTVQYLVTDSVPLDYKPYSIGPEPDFH